MANVFHTSTFTSSFNDSFFFDTNVWIFLFCPIAGNRKNEQQAYSNLYKSLIQGNRGIFVNSMVLSEFANTYLRIDFNLWKKDTSNFRADYKKDFVGTTRFKDTVSDIKVAINQILKKSERMTDDFNAIDLDHVFSEFGRADFNDAYYLELAQMNDWKIVTHDRDLFKDNEMDVDIITALN